MQLYHVTSRTIKALDSDQHKLTNEYGIQIVLRDRKWIIDNVNYSNATIQAFNTYLYPDLHYLQSFGSSNLVRDSPHIGDARTVCVFLRQEVDRRAGRDDLMIAVVDSLLLWALENTDPVANRLMSREEIEKRVNDVLPLYRLVDTNFIGRRLESLSSKANPSGREVRWHRKDDVFCLPFETRKQVQRENTEDEALRARVIDNLEERIQAIDEEVSPRDVARIALSSIQMTFEARGLTLAASLEDGEGDPRYVALSISEQVDHALVLSASETHPSRVKDVAMAVIRQTLYESTDDERLYFGKLSRTYSLFLTLKSDIKVVEYFQSMSSQLRLYVGTDILVRSLSERYLKSEDQMTCNLLLMLRKSGAELILAEPTLDEVYSHLTSTHRDFVDTYEGIEDNIDVRLAGQEPRILIRAYLHARRRTVSDMKTPTDWREFIGQICTYNDLGSRLGREQVRRYLLEKFRLIYMTTEDLDSVTTSDEIQVLANEIEDVRSRRPRILAENDARMVLAVYGTRREQGEEKVSSPFGYRTWWLTDERRVIQATRDMVRKYGARYIIRPEFLLHYVAFSPSMEEVRQAFRKVFPTLLGIKLSNRMREDDFRKMMRDARAVAAVDDARAKVMLGELSDKLKSDFNKSYSTSQTKESYQ